MKLIKAYIRYRKTEEVYNVDISVMLCHPFRLDCARQTGLNCATYIGDIVPSISEQVVPGKPD